jgi:hypothetical protein
VFDSGIVVGKVPPGPIEVKLNPSGRIVGGIVVDANEKPVPHAVVVLVPPIERRQNSALYFSAASDGAGQFWMTGVAPGKYKIFAWEKVLPTAWQNADFISKFEKQGRDVEVKVKIISRLRIRAI